MLMMHDVIWFRIVFDIISYHFIPTEEVIEHLYDTDFAALLKAKMLFQYLVPFQAIIDLGKLSTVSPIL